METVLLVVLGIFIGSTLRSRSTPNPEDWMRAAARSGLVVKMSSRPSPDGLYQTEFTLSEDPEAVIARTARALREEAVHKAVAYVKDRRGCGHEEALRYVNAL